MVGAQPGNDNNTKNKKRSISKGTHSDNLFGPWLITH